MYRSLFAIAMLLALLPGCAGPDPRRYADQIAAGAGLARSEVQTDVFRLVAYTRMRDPEQPVHFYIEGDGLAWLSRTRLSSDPTPRRAQGLELATADPAPNVVYIARPCQFADLSRFPCDSGYWSHRRFSEEVIRSMNQAVDILVPRASFSNINLIGYSGGAAVAALIACRRDDVAGLRTVAGNLAVEAVNRHHEVSAMPESLDPIDVASHIADIPQVHFIGSGDAVIPGFVAASFAQQAGRGDCVRVVEIQGATHGVGWTRNWANLLLLAPRCAHTNPTPSATAE
jgi:pimeloyl-ACP methyl ester carboxylesterase